MAILKLGTIGTSMITELFIQAAQQTEQYELHVVYSRNKEKAEAFAKPYKARKIYDQFDSFLSDSELDVIYIASPNSLHYEQTLAALRAKKHVIVEKPAFTQPDCWEKVEKLADEQGCVVIEAIRHIHEPNFKKVQEEIKDIGEIQGALFSYMSYSSRYDLVKEGEEPNIFSPKFAGGALMDLGVYTVYSAVALFGEPDSVQCFTQMIETNVDGRGVAILRYPNFDVTLLFAKTATSMIPGEIYGSKATLQLDSITVIDKIKKIHAKTKESAMIDTEKVEKNMLFDEAKVYAEVLTDPNNPENKKKIDQWFLLSKKVGQTIYALRQEGGIIFPMDKE